MKRISTYLGLAAMFFSLVSCQEYKESVIARKTVNVSFATSVDDSKTKVSIERDDQSNFITDWNEGDEITVNYGSFSAEATWNADNAVFDATLDESATTTEYTYRAVYPVLVENSVAFGSERTQVGNAVNGKYDVMLSKPVTTTVTDGGTVHFEMKRQTAIQYFKFVSKGLGDIASEKVKSATLTVTGEKANIAGSFIWAEGALSPVDTAKSIKISFDPETAPTADSVVLWFNVIPAEYESLTLELETRYHKIQIANSKGGSFEAEKLYKTELDLSAVTFISKWEVIPVFYESFDKCNSSGGNDGKWNEGGSGTLIFDNNDWANVKGNGASKCAKFGTSSVAGSATTPALCLTSDIHTLVFKAGAWTGDSLGLEVSIIGSGFLSQYEVTLKNSEFSEYHISIVGADAESKIKFEAKQASKNRFFLDSVLVFRGGEAFDYIYLAKKDTTVLHTATSVVFPLETASAWTIDNISEELTVEPMSGNGNASITASFAENKTASTKTYSFDITAGSKKETITINQKGDPNIIEELTIAEFLDKEVGDAYYKLCGKVISIADYKYGNLTIEDATGDVYVYGVRKEKGGNNTVFSELEIEVGDSLTLIGQRAEHNNTAQVSNAYHVSHVSAPRIAVTPKSIQFSAEGGSSDVTIVGVYGLGDNPQISALSKQGKFQTFVSEGKVTVTAAENSTENVIEDEVIISATDGKTTISDTVTVTQAKPVPAAKDGDVLWSEDFSGFKADDAPTSSNANTVIYYGGSVTYICVHSTSDTKIYADKLAGGTSPEILVSKNGGSFTVSDIPVKGVTAMTLTYKANNTNLTITSSTTGAEVYGKNEDKNWKIVVPEDTETLTISFSNSSGNTRLDDIVLKAGIEKTDPAITPTNKTITLSGDPASASQDLTEMFESTSDGEFTYSLKETSSTAGISGDTFTATAKGEYTIVATQAATAIYNSASKEAKITVGAFAVIEINSTNSGVSGSYSTNTFNVGEVTFGYTQWMKKSDAAVIQAKASTAKSLYNNVPVPGTIKSITFVQTGTARAIEVYGGTIKQPSNEITAPATAATMTFDFSGKDCSYFTMTTPGSACYFSSISITYEPGEPPMPANHTVSVDGNITGGIVSADPTSAIVGTEITLTATPSEGYSFGSWNVKDASDNTISVVNNKFTMPDSDVTVSATFKEAGGGEITTSVTYEWLFPTSGTVANSTGFTDKNNTSGTMLKAYTSKNAENGGSWTCISNGAYFNVTSGGYLGIQVPITSATTNFEISADLFGWKSGSYAEKAISKVSYYTTVNTTEVEVTPSESPKTTTSGCYNLSVTRDLATGYQPSSDTNQYLYIRIYIAAGNDGFESLSVTVK